jgi:O-acetyl-ADP-ribose deacetylase (regulator of RNase III)
MSVGSQHNDIKPNMSETAIPIKYVCGDATAPPPGGNRIIVHICNDHGSWEAGFIMAVSRRWIEPKACYCLYAESFKGKPLELGAVQFMQVEDCLWVANVIGQTKAYTTREGRRVPPIPECMVCLGLHRVYRKVMELQATIHMPRIGTGLAGGKWDDIKPIIDEELADLGISVTVYDLENVDT